MKVVLLFAFIITCFIPGYSNAAVTCKSLIRAQEEIRVRDMMLSDVPALEQIFEQPQSSAMMNRRLKDGFVSRVFRRIISQAENPTENSRGIAKSIVETDSNEPIGFLSVYPIDRQTRVGVVGYTLDSKFWNRGYLTVALEQLVYEAFEERGLYVLDAAVAVSNIASQRVLEKVGFRRLDRIPDPQPEMAIRSEDVYIYRLMRFDALFVALASLGTP